ncbi:MAG TPA: ferritin-like domain-containing protein [Candidatus Limnocylindria bacterium]|nr:ferritin-like domain-containing protein [Candidatus Limnocylindria bacterium]
MSERYTPIPEPPTGALEAVAQRSDAVFNWAYQLERPSLVNLYEKAKTLQWNASTDIDWSISVDPERFPEFFPPEAFNTMLNPPRHLELRELKRLRVEQLGWMLSQFLHGEQGALLATAQIVTTVPWTEAKFYAASQVADEARHVEVYRRYLTEKLPYAYPVNPHLHTLLDQIVRESRWDMTYLGMQIMVEGLALAAFGMMHLMNPHETLLHQITNYVIRDEARHVAFGVLSLEEAYRDMTERERREREEFVIEAAMLMRDRLLMNEVWERLGFDVKAWTAWSLSTPFMGGFRQLLFSKIVPNLKRLGLLTPRVREAFERIGVLEFEHMPDSTQDESVSLPPQVLAFLGRVVSQVGTPGARAS